MSEYNKLAKKKNNINTTEIIDFFQLKKLIITQTLMKLKKTLLIMIMINILLLKNLIINIR